MEDKVMEFYAEVHHTECSSSFRPFVPPTATGPSMLLALEDAAMRDYNSEDDSDYEDESSYASTEEDEEVPNTPMVGGPRLILHAPLPIPDLANVPSYFKQLDIDERHVEGPTMESVDVEYNTDGGAEFMVGLRMLFEGMPCEEAAERLAAEERSRNQNVSEDTPMKAPWQTAVQAHLRIPKQAQRMEESMAEPNSCPASSKEVRDN
ncbi:hypothetical protein PIB30_101443 [Stylosanthes scabra]|uniref:Uncharacterized protein n=1 Tax=Stylosanthes scabra TaxID=79078 RepID=A0ABU6TZF3_9FABA|nr:hypothetical protein [Stylosanthes scabra]